VAVREVANEPVASQGTTVAADHLRISTGFINKNQPVRVEMRLPESPSSA